MPSSVKEDYLKAIYELEKAAGIAKTTKLAGKLGLSAATVSEMIQRLSRESPRLIIYKHHQGVYLSSVGKKKALEIIRRHRLLETFLHKTLGLSWDEVHEEAEVLEHHLSERVTEAIDRHLDFPQFDPHGEPIPDKTGHIISQPQLKLSEIEEGQKFKIVSVAPASRELLVYLGSLDIGIHSSGIVLSKSPLEGPITLKIDCHNSQRMHTLGRNVTDQIYVEKL
jgi:DtxR family Mn-dependent transcriptional regulator